MPAHAKRSWIYRGRDAWLVLAALFAFLVFAPFSSWHGVLITTSYWIAYAASRLVFAVIGHFINVKVCSVTSVCCCRLHTTNTTLTYSLKRPYMNKL